ncbi:MAG: hypothetical protein QW140_00875 [Candidatus Aenigmatarchaeota archaeon]
MLKEEVRIHTHLFPSIFFYLFPVMIFLFSFFLKFVIQDTFFLTNLFFIVVFFTGFSSGGYGVQAREIYLRKFPHLNFLLYSYLAMPIENSKIMLALFSKEVIFHFFWFLLPFVFGIFGFSISVLIQSIILFLFANSLSFLLSNLYNRKILFISTLIISAILIFSLFNFMIHYPAGTLLATAFIFYLSLKTVDFEYYSKKVYHKNLFDSLIKYFKSPLISKDFIDLKRSYGIFRIAFSFILPVIITFFIFTIFKKLGIIFMPEDVFYSLMLGLVSISVYATLIEFDRWDYYAILPLKRSDLIKSKLKSSLVIAIPLLLVSISLIARATLTNFLIGLVSMFYIISILVYLIGLEVSLLFDVRRILVFALLFAPYFLLIILSPNIYLILLIFSLISLLFFKFGLNRFD